jgi:hypothetical protein
MALAGPSSPGSDAGGEWEAMDHQQEQAGTTPVVESPSISAGWPDAASQDAADWPSVAREDLESHADTTSRRPGPLRRLLPPFPRPHLQLPAGTLTTACAAMGALVLALIVWRADIVRLLPQTALFYRMVGFEVNLRGLDISNETVDGKPILVIEGVIVGETRKPVELPRLRFSVRDAQGAEIYAWNAVLDQPVLKPGERAFFKSRLASPPPEGRNIDIRFFNKRDLAGGHA